jgi:hypothetical protein
MISIRYLGDTDVILRRVLSQAYYTRRCVRSEGLTVGMNNLSRHCAGTAAGNYGVPVVVNGASYGFASGAAPRAR